MKLPDPIVSRSNVIRVTFRTNENVTGDGFKLEAIRECGRTFDSGSPNEGLIQSPGFVNYDPNLNCVFIFNRTKNDFIVLKLEEFDVTDCPNDYLMIMRDHTLDSSKPTTVSELVQFHFQSNLNMMLISKKMGPFCGENRPPDVITSNQFLKLAFVTDSVKSSRGFKFSYKIVQCGQDFVGVDSGLILSPNVDSADDSNYIHNADCNWSIKVEEGYSIVLRFEYLSIEVSMLHLYMMIF